MDWLYDYISENAFWTILLLIHGLISVALLGALTHQAMAVLMPVKKIRVDDSFVTHFRAVTAQKYTKAICYLWISSFIFGAWIYAQYRIYVRIPIEQLELYKTLGVFEMKEHLVVFGLGMLPIYSYVWKHMKNVDYDLARKCTTLFLTGVCWYAFLIGHIVNNVRGYGS